MIFTKITGNKGEIKAAREYKKRGYKILARNFSCRFGELDIVARRHNTIVIAEVKTRKNADFAQAREFVDSHKQKRLISTAKLFLQQNSLMDCIIRFDVVEVYTDTDKINIIENAF